ncbi:outer dynein arm-docking complex subunit 3-like [Platichthys flesus]|uniref:outer dynein arm-docking complex subunit 3-like n=1 Tax=Platichthys flesus TaxID=8260 RepID=UPI002DB78821|nr:outer dynein arm-docking complex subunit 3-like [Platichthys flesus]
METDEHTEKIRAAKRQSYHVTIKTKDETIHKLKEQNLDIAKEISVRNIAETQNVVPFPDRDFDCTVFRIPGKKAESTASNDINIKMKHLNKLKNTTQRYQQRLVLLRKEHQRLKPENEHCPPPPNFHDREEEETARFLRSLEIQMEKTGFQCSQAVFNLRDHQKLIALVQGGSMTCKSRSGHLDTEIQKNKAALHQLQAKNNKTQLANKALQAKSQQLKELYDEEENKRELNLIAHRKKAQEAARKDVSPESDDDKQDTHILYKDFKTVTANIAQVTKLIRTFEASLKNIKLVVGESENQKLVGTLIQKRERHSQLEKQKKENDVVLHGLRKQRDLLLSEFKQIDFSYSLKLYNEQQELAEQSRCSAVAVELRSHLDLFTNIKERIGYLADKLQHITLSEDRVTSASADSYELVLEQLSMCVEKLQVLKDDLKGGDLAALRKEMKEINDSIEKRLPSYNTRINLPEPGLERHEGGG